MASISKDARGNRTIQFVGKDRKRRSIRMGKCSQRQAEAVKVHVERLVHANITGHPVDPDTSRWLTQTDGPLMERLAAVGLVEARETKTLGELISGYFESRGDVSQSTLTVWGHTRRNLVDYFGADRALRSITAGDAEDWSHWLAKQNLAETTRQKRHGFAKQFAAYAVRKGWVPENPFAELPSGLKTNRARMHFIPRDVADRVLEACPDAEWRLIFALSRFGGLRCPSEHLNLKLGHVNWDELRLTIPGVKTPTRALPIFPEMLPHLEAVYDRAEPGTEYLITRYRKTNANLRTQFLRILERAGIAPWPKLFHNLRSTRQTELEEQFPSHVVCAWLGNSESIARKHYLQLTDEHFERAVRPGSDSAEQRAAESGAVDAPSGADAVHFPVQQPAAMSRPETQKPLTESGVMRSKSKSCEPVRLAKVEDRGSDRLNAQLLSIKHVAEPPKTEIRQEFRQIRL